MTSLAAISLGQPQEICCDKVKTHCSVPYERAIAIFRIFAMALQYLVVKLSVTLRHWHWMPSALPKNNIKVVSRNIANFSVLQKCLSTAWRPYSKNLYQEMGLTNGLRITHDIIFRPASGLCLGQSFNFLSEYFLSKEVGDVNQFISAAHRVQGNENVLAIELQAIYDGLIAFNGAVQSNERDFFFKILKGKDFISKETSNPELLASLKAFLSIEDRPEPLRQFVLDEMDKKGIEISVDLYALILELDTIWYLQQHPGEYKNDSVHNAIIQTVAHFLQLEMIDMIRLKGSILSVRDQLKGCKAGCYLIQFSNHTVPFVKVHDLIALFEPNEGLALLEEADQEAGLLQFLKHYGRNDQISLRMVSIQPKDALLRC